MKAHQGWAVALCRALQGMAGNIIHAIATTNAIVSGLIVIEALKLLAGAPAACQTSFLHQQVRLEGLVAC